MGLRVGAATAQQADARPAPDSVGAAAPRTPGSTGVPGGWFYRGRDFGSDAYGGPLDAFLNKGFATTAFEGRSRNLVEHDFGERSVHDALAHPLEAIARGGGWREQLGTQVFPSNMRWDDWEWYPNWLGHVVEGGIVYRRLAEQLAAQGVPAASLLAGMTTMAASYVNEMYEVSDTQDGIASTVFDLYLFDPLGVLLFSRDGVARFFSETIGANVWPGQASFTFPDGELANAGNNLVFKLPSPIAGTSVFFRTGVSAHLGLTHHRPGGLDLSWGIGADATRQTHDPETGKERVELLYSAAVFLDRDESLLVSAYWSRVRHRMLTLNVYPGVADVLGGYLGAWLILDDRWRPSLGLSSTHTLGLGLGFGS